jgi:hypothetical protein
VTQFSESRYSVANFPFFVEKNLPKSAEK